MTTRPADVVLARGLNAIALDEYRYDQALTVTRLDDTDLIRLTVDTGADTWTSITVRHADITRLLEVDA